MNNYMIEFLNLDGAYQYETFMADDQFEAVDDFKTAYPKCEPYAVFMELNSWKKEEEAV